jgi:hypothetical protein
MQKLHSLLGALALSSLAFAQSTAQIPNPAVFAGGGSSGNIWRAGTNRVQCFYDSTNWTGQSLGAPITISGLEWRTGAGITVAAPITYPSVDIYVLTMAGNYSAPSTTFATNRATPLGTPNYSGPVTLQASTGGQQWCINIPLTTPYQYSPDSGADLLVEIVINSNPTPLTGTTMDCGFTNPTHLCNSVRSVGAPASLTGSASAFCPVIRTTYTPVPGAASHAAYGTGCTTRARSFYELFTGAGSNDLTGKTVSMQQNGIGGYVVTSAAGGVIAQPNTVGLALGDDQMSAAIALPFTFDYPGGSTSSIFVDSNGSIHLNVVGTSNIGGSAAQLLSVAYHTISASMQDLLPDGTVNVANCFAQVNPSNPSEFDITWLNVPCFGSVATPVPTSTFQIALIDNGVNDSVELRFQTLVNDSSSQTSNAITGFSLGNGAINGGSQDISASVIVTQPDASPLTLAASPRPILGSSATYTLSNVRANAGVSAMNIGFVSSAPTPLSLYGLDAPGCNAHIAVIGSVPFGPLLLTSPSASFSQAWPNIPSFAGVSLFAQGFELAPAENNAGVIVSNGLEIKLGSL